MDTLHRFPFVAHEHHFYERRDQFTKFAFMMAEQMLVIGEHILAHEPDGFDIDVANGPVVIKLRYGVHSTVTGGEGKMFGQDHIVLYYCVRLYAKGYDLVRCLASRAAYFFCALRLIRSSILARSKSAKTLRSLSRLITSRLMWTIFIYQEFFSYLFYVFFRTITPIQYIPVSIVMHLELAGIAHEATIAQIHTPQHLDFLF